MPRATTKKAPKPKEVVAAPQPPKAKTSDDGIRERLNEKDKALTWEPTRTERIIKKYVNRRVEEMIDFRKGLNIEKRWLEADEEYVPHELDFGTTRKRFETDQDTGLRSRMVPVGDITQQWRQASSAPTLLSKIQTAVSVIIDGMPEGDLVPLLKKYEGTTDLAYALWKRNWQITDAKEKLKLVIFNLIKYGWAPQRTYPRLVKYDKRIRTEVDTENPDNDKYENRENVWFNDIDRQPLNPLRTWIDEMSKPYDPYSTNETYFEDDYSYDAAKVEFGKYSNFKYIKRDSVLIRNDEQRKSNRQSTNEQMKTRQDVVTLGFFESRLKDLFVIWAPKDGIIVYNSPLPNDDGYLAVTHTLWMLRNAKLPYGVSLWEVIRQNKALYDKWKNMTFDQLVLSIMKFGFFSGTNTAVGDGKIEIVPGQARQLTSSSGKPEVNWMEIPGPGMEAWKGGEYLKNEIDDDSGITPTLAGEVTGKTLGEILHAKEASLKRLKTPLQNIAWLIEQDAYVTLSWMSQVYTIPEIKEFANETELLAYEKENAIGHYELFQDVGEDGIGSGPIQASFLPQLALHLEDRDGQLVKSKKSQFLQVGKDIKPHQIKWRGIFKVIPRSIIDSSQTLVKAAKMEMFNMLIPILQYPPELVAKAARQILKVNEEDPMDWLPEAWSEEAMAEKAALEAAMQQAAQAMAQGGAAAGGSIFTPAGGTAAPGAAPAAPGQTMQAAAGAAPQQAPTVVPRGEVSAPSGRELMGGAQPGKGLFGRGL